MKEKGENASVTLFREYLRFNTAPPYPELANAIEFLSDLGAKLGCFQEVLNISHPKAEQGSWLPMLVLTLPGENPTLESLLLYSHIDVVPAYSDQWEHDPFSGFKDEKGNIFGRGAQDMKCISIQYLEALRRIQESGQQLKRTIHLVFGPDEETHSYGIEGFLDTKKFKSMNVGLALDEGIANTDNIYRLYHGCKSVWQLKVSCEGNAGHGSKFIPETAAEKFNKVVRKFLDFRDSEKNRLSDGSKLKIEDVVSVNLTKVEGGCEESLNVVPATMNAYFDIRVPPGYDEKGLYKRFQSWAVNICLNNHYSEGSIRIEWLNACPLDSNKPTPLEGSKWWQEFEHVFKQMGRKLIPEIFFAGTDTRFLRKKGYPVFGFSPIINTPQLLHDHNEYLNEDIFMDGIDIYQNLILALANV